METKNVQKAVKKPMKKTVKKTSERLSKKQLLAIVISVVVVVVAIVCIYYISLNNSYKKYKVSMEWYKLNMLYNNSKASSLANVKKAEAIKVLTGTITNKTSENDINVAITFFNRYENEKWVAYANKYGANIELTKDEANGNITVYDATIIAVKLVEGFLDVKIDSNIEIKFSNRDQFSAEEKQYIAKAINIGLLENSNKKIDVKKVARKGDINKIAITVLEKYATVYYKSLYGSYGEGETRASIITNTSELPTNYMEYPYVITTIPKEIYEVPFEVRFEDNYKTPKVAYEYRGKGYSMTEKNIEGYFDKILNVDYTKIDKENFVKSIEEYMVYDMSQTVLNNKSYTQNVYEYVQYVIDNQIILKGSAQALLPIIYDDGITYKLRTKIQFEVVNSNTNTNLLLGDTNVTYTGKSFSTYVDIPVGIVYGNDALRIYNLTSVMSYMLTDYTANIEVAK